MKMVVPTILFVIFSAWFSFFLAHYTINTDFPVFYNAAKAIIEGKSVYDLDNVKDYQVPETLNNGTFIYSLPVAYFMAPLALLSYYKAKTAIIFFSIISYLFAIAIILKTNKVKDRWSVYPLVLSVLFMPFIQDIRAAQVNSLILFLIVVSIYFAQKDLPYVCGIILAFAALYKIFPIAVALILGLKNWRIAATCSTVFTSSFLIPGSLEWVASITNIYHAGYVPLFILLGPYWFVLYGMIIAGLTALIVLRVKIINYPLFASFSIPAVFLTMPIVEYYHLVLMMLPYIYLLTWHKRDCSLIIALFFSFVLITAAFFFSLSSVYFPSNPTLSGTFITLGLALLWGVLAWKMTKQEKRPPRVI